MEVFYAHTISPIAIAVITSIVMVCFLGNLHVAYGVLGLVFYVLVGVVIPLVNGKKGGIKGQQYRNSFGELNTCVLDNLYGLEEILEYQQQEVRLGSLQERTDELGEITGLLKKDENAQRVITEGVILFVGVARAILGANLVNSGRVSGADAMIAVIAMTSSFGPTAALSALSNNLHHTLASGNRVLDILEETPVVEDVVDGVELCVADNVIVAEDTRAAQEKAVGGNSGGNIICDNVSFAYTVANARAGITQIADATGITNELGVLKDFSATFAENKIHGILGKSGCGKSTLLKLLMRFYETDNGSISYGNQNVNDINTNSLRSNIAYVTQETFLFTDSIENNIRVAKAEATREEIIEAAKKASIHDFIMSTPDGYDTKLAELGDSISGGEKQRIGIARAFLHDSKMIFLDEPTSNIDSLNEGMILRSLEQEKKDKTIILVSHRKSTMGIADEVKAM